MTDGNSNPGDGSHSDLPLPVRWLYSLDEEQLLGNVTLLIHVLDLLHLMERQRN